MRVLFCGGGTAGHVTPAIAMSEMLKRSVRGASVAYVGRVGGDENEAFKKTGNKLYFIEIQGLKRSFSIGNLSAIIKIIKASRAAREIISDFKPDVIVGTGGYVSYPVIRQGQRLKIPTVIHESNAYPGLVTRALAPKCDAVLLNLEGAKEYLRRVDNTHVVGNPVRTRSGNLSKGEARARLGIAADKKLIVSFGGSLGARAVNDAVIEMMLRYSAPRRDITHLHAVGKRHYEEIRDKHRALCEGYNDCRLVPYIEDVPTLLRAADLAITRSGAMTVSELAFAATPAILIPSTNVTGNHQLANARYVCSRGGGRLIEESELTAERLISASREILDSKSVRESLSCEISRLYPRDVEKKIVKILKNVTA